MTNPFDREDYVEVTPDCIVVGSFAGWKLDLDYDTAEFSLGYVLSPVGSTSNANDITVDGSQVQLTDDTYWVFEIDSATSTAFTLPKDTDHKWDLMLTQTSSGNKVSIRSGFINVFTSSSDRRSHAEIMLVQINSLLEGRAKSDVASYSIKSRSLTRMALEELMMWRDYYIAEVRRTGGSANSAAGKKKPKQNTVQVRFTDD